MAVRAVTRRELRLARILRVDPPDADEPLSYFRMELHAKIVFALLLVWFVLLVFEVVVKVVVS